MAHKYAKEMHRWADSPNGTGVWTKNDVLAEWFLTNYPEWAAGDYIVDDEFAIVRKAQAEGRLIQANIQWQSNCPETFERGWNDFDGEVKGDHNGTKVVYRIKPEIEIVWQYICQHRGSDDYKLTVGKYTDINSARESQIDSCWVVIGRFIRSKTLKEVE